MTDESLKIIITQHAGLIIVSLAVTITVSVCFVAAQWRKARQADSALVLKAAILSRGGQIPEMKRESTSQHWLELALLKLFESIPKEQLGVPLMLLSFIPLLLILLFVPVIEKATRYPTKRDQYLQRSAQKMASSIVSVDVNNAAQLSSTPGEIQIPISTTDNFAIDTSTENVVPSLTSAGVIAPNLKAIIAGPICKYSHDWKHLDAEDHPMPLSLSEKFKYD